MHQAEKQCTCGAINQNENEMVYRIGHPVHLPNGSKCRFGGDLAMLNTILAIQHKKFEDYTL
jgi:hypothetical protein